jgi:hypothetical protein
MSSGTERATIVAGTEKHARNLLSRAGAFLALREIAKVLTDNKGNHMDE